MNDLTFNGNYDLYAFKINLNKYGVQSLYLDKAVNIPSGISAAYISEVIKNETGQYKTTWKDIFNIIPAYTPVVFGVKEMNILIYFIMINVKMNHHKIINYLVF